jgi:RNA polymerase sigma factor (sigma-70 family)
MRAAQIPHLEQGERDTVRPDVTEMTVTELVAAARSRQQRAWDELMRRYGSLVRAVVGRYRLQEADAADAVQNTWCKAVEQLDAVRDPERLGAWLSTTAGRECLALIRRARRERPDDAAVTARVSTAGGPEAAVLAAEIEGAVTAAVAELGPRRRRLVRELFYLPEQDYALVSRSMGIPLGSIGPTRGRVLVSLRTSLERAGFGPQHVTDRRDRETDLTA